MIARKGNHPSIDVIDYAIYNKFMIALVEIRQRAGLYQRELARRAGVAYKTLQRIETGRYDCRWSTLRRLARALDAPNPHLLLRKAGGAGLVAEATTTYGDSGSGSWKTWLFEIVDAFRRRPDPSSVARAPGPE